MRGLSPIPDSRVFLTGSGSESIDTAMKLARIAHIQAGQPQRTLIISRVRGYHGTNYGGTSAQGIAPNRENFGPLVGDVVHPVVIKHPLSGREALYVPRLCYFTGNLDIHDVAVTKQGGVIFANTRFNCLATLSPTHSFRPLWKPHFISRLAGEDRAHRQRRLVREEPGQRALARSTHSLAGLRRFAAGAAAATSAPAS